MLEWVLHYAALGYGVLAVHSVGDDGQCTCNRPNCGSPGKHPLLRRGVKDASSDPEVVRRWWQRWPTANVGVAIPKGCIVLDVDSEEGLQSALSLGLTDDIPACRTARGWHYWLSAPPGMEPRSTVGLAPGLDVRATGSFVVAPPSRHVSGRTYEWEVPLVPPSELPEAPQWLLELLGATAPARRDGHRAAKTTLDPAAAQQIRDAALERWREGERHNLALHLSGWARKRGQPEEEVAELVSAVATEAGDPELPDRLRAVADTYAKDPSEVAGWSRLPQPLRAALGTAMPVATKVDSDLLCDRLHYSHARGFLVDNFRRIVGGRTWLRWVGTHWAEVDEATVTTALTDFLAPYYADRYADAMRSSKKQEAETWLDLAKEASRVSRMQSVVRYAAGRSELQVRREDLDRDDWALCVANGTLDLRTGRLRGHRREDLITKVAPVVFDPEATWEEWQAHLDLCLTNKNIQRHLQRSLGRALTGAVLDETIDFWYGPAGKNGKSTSARVMMALLGPYARKAAPKLLVRSHTDRHPTELCDLQGSRLVFSAELDSSDALNVALLKDICGGDLLTARRLYEDFYTFSRTFCVFLLTNVLPRVDSFDGGTWRRIRVVPWTQQVPEERRLPQDTVVERLTQGKAGSGLLNWLLAGLRDFERDPGWTPEEVRIATDLYKTSQDPVGEFLAEHCDVGPHFRCRLSTFLAEYTEWCTGAGVTRLDAVDVARVLAQHGIEKRRLREGGTRAYFLLGVRLRAGSTRDSEVDTAVHTLQESPLEFSSRRDFTENPGHSCPQAGTDESSNTYP